MNRRDFLKVVSVFALFGGWATNVFAKKPSSTTKVVVVTSGVNIGAYQCYVTTKRIPPGALSILLGDG